MKKLFLGASIFLFLSFFIFSTPALAQEPTVVSVSMQEATQTATPPAKVEYVLPYPGILPDNPLYFLKAGRDRLVSFLINDAEKKAEFNLLTSDKRVSAAWMLATRGKDELAVTTLSKSNNYLDQAIAAAATTKSSGKNVDTVLSNIKNAIIKHEELLTAIEKKVNKSFALQLRIERTRLVGFGKSVEKLLPHN